MLERETYSIETEQVFNFYFQFIFRLLAMLRILPQLEKRSMSCNIELQNVGSTKNTTTEILILVNDKVIQFDE